MRQATGTARLAAGRLERLDERRDRLENGDLATLTTDEQTPRRGFRRHTRDLRRSAVRNLQRAGVPRSVAVKLTRHKTESVYRRDAIAEERDLHVVVESLEAMVAVQK